MMDEAIILAGGFGTRLRTVISDVPKPMAPVGGRPFLEWLLERLAGQGIRRVVMSVGYKADEIARHFGPTFAGLDLAYAIEEEPLGTGGAVRESLKRCIADHVLVLNGDTFLELELSAVEAHWAGVGTPIIVAREVEDVGRYGKLMVEQGRVVGFAEKSAGGQGLINAGCYVLPRDIARSFPTREKFSLENDFLVDAVKHAAFAVFVTRGYFIDIGVPEDYARAQFELPSRCA